MDLCEIILYQNQEQLTTKNRDQEISSRLGCLLNGASSSPNSSKM